MPCKYWDSGWCYAPEGLDTNADGQGGCGGMLTCPQADSPNLPPINLNVLQSAYNFYSDDTSNDYGCDTEEHW